MRRILKTALSLVCAIALLASLGVGALAYTDEEIETFDDSTRHDYLTSPQYTQFSNHRLRSEMEIFLPVAYDTWSFDDGNYGPTAEEYASLGIDLNAWYAAQ